MRKHLAVRERDQDRSSVLLRRLPLAFNRTPSPPPFWREIDAIFAAWGKR
jgi:hypothetical protein